MSPKEACTEWARLLRAVAAGEMPAPEALARIPEVEDEDTVPKAYWSARTMLEMELVGGVDPDGISEYDAGVLRKLADRIEQHDMLKET